MREPYPSDLSDAEWAILAPLLPPPRTTGRPRQWPDRLIADAVVYVLRGGCAWRMLPREFPPWPTVFSRFQCWRLDGTLRRAHDVLRVLARRQAGRAPEPTAAVIDSQSAKTTGVGGPARGYDGGKRVHGRKRHISVDVMGLVLAACVHAADVQDRAGAGSSSTRLSRPCWRPCNASGRTRATPARAPSGCTTGAGGGSRSSAMPTARSCGPGSRSVQHAEGAGCLAAGSSSARSPGSGTPGG
jgi:transposase